MRATRRSIAAAILFSPFAANSAAAEWPADRPVQVIVPFPPGGGVDQMARLLLPYAERHLNARPDGYILGAITSHPLVRLRRRDCRRRRA